MENYFVDYIIKLRIYINTYDMIENVENVLNIFILKIFLYISFKTMKIGCTTIIYKI